MQARAYGFESRRVIGIVWQLITEHLNRSLKDVERYCWCSLKIKLGARQAQDAKTNEEIVNCVISSPLFIFTLIWLFI